LRRGTLAGTLVAVWAWRGQLWLRYSRDDGTTWSPTRDLPVPVNTAHRELSPTLAESEDGRLCLAFLSGACLPLLGGRVAAGDVRPPDAGVVAEERPRDPLTMARWSPYVVGAGIGVLSWLTFLLSDKPIGCSTAFARSAGLLERAARGAKVDEKPYYQQIRPHIDWEWMLVFGIFFGALASALLSGQFQLVWVPATWAGEAGGSALVRWLVALFGGMCIGFGARWAGGCTSGHGISGTLQLAVSGWIAAAGFFVGGIATAMALFKVILA
jgi:hypothetical protein